MSSTSLSVLTVLFLLPGRLPPPPPLPTKFVTGCQITLPQAHAWLTDLHSEGSLGPALCSKPSLGQLPLPTPGSPAGFPSCSSLHRNSWALRAPVLSLLYFADVGSSPQSPTVPEPSSSGACSHPLLSHELSQISTAGRAFSLLNSWLCVCPLLGL